MSRSLPAELVERLGTILGDELPDFVAAHLEPAVRGLRLDPRKITSADLGRVLDLALEPVPWCPTGFRLPSAARAGLGDTLAHRAGLFYLQEPSAMAPPEVLARGLGDDLEGARVIDLAAAPGGKATRLTELVGPDGLVVANEIERKRLSTLHENLGRWGATNAATTSKPLDVLASAAPGTFDAALLDAPCTGEGMFRRDPEAVRQWSPAAVRGAARRQAGLLQAAQRLVAPGGVLVYSTCTFALEENEDRVAALLAEHPDWTIEECRFDPPLAPGVPVEGRHTERAIRLWPHHVAGEGHFVALLRLDPGARHSSREPVAARALERAKGRKPGRNRAGARPAEAEVARAWREFQQEQVPSLGGGRVVARGDQVFLEPTAVNPVPAELLARPGLPLGRARPGRFEPSQALAGLLGADQVERATCWSPDDDRWPAYLRGEEIPDRGTDGWVLVCAHGWGVGWARRRGGTLKNFLPAALRSRR